LGCGVECLACFLEGDQAAGELEKGEVVLVFLAPADQDAAVSVQPGMGRLYDPASRAPASRARFEFDLFAAGANVRGVAVCAREAVDRW